MNTKKRTYKGVIGEDSFGFLAIDGVPVAESVSNDFAIGDTVSVRYYISDQEMTEDQAAEALMTKIYGSVDEASYELEAYSEFTIEEWREGLVIGGHDLISEIWSHRNGKFILLIIERVTHAQS